MFCYQKKVELVLTFGTFEIRINKVIELIPSPSFVFATTYAISAYHHWCCEFESRSGRDVQHYVIKFVSDLRQVGGFLRVHQFPPPIKLNTAEILLKVALNTIKQTKKSSFVFRNNLYICILFAIWASKKYFLRGTIHPQGISADFCS